MDNKKWLLDEYLFAKEELEPDIHRYTNRLFWLHRPVLHVTQGVFQPEFMVLSSQKEDTYFRLYTLVGIDRPRQVVELDVSCFYHVMIYPRESAGYWPRSLGGDKEISLLSPDTEVLSDPAADQLNKMLKEGQILAWLEKPTFRTPEFQFDFMVIGRDGKMVFYLKTKSKPSQTTLATLHWLKSLHPRMDFRVMTITRGKWYEAYTFPLSNTSKELEAAAKQLGLEGGL